MANPEQLEFFYVLTGRAYPQYFPMIEGRHQLRFDEEAKAHVNSRQVGDLHCFREARISA
jgi:hypothetical protein